MDSSKMARKLRGQIEKFSGEVCCGLGKVASRFVCQMVYGIQASQSVLLSEIARTLEEPIRLKKTHERLVRQLDREGLGEALQAKLVQLAGDRVGDDTLLVVDVSEITKLHAEKMEHLCRVRDGSDGSIKPGYWTMQVVATDLEAAQLVPLYQKLYSSDAPQFESENDEVMKAVRTVARATGKRGIWVIDCGGDRKRGIIKPLLEEDARFIIRLRGDRHVVSNGRTMTALDAAARCRCRYAETVVKGTGEDRKVYHIRFGYRRVKVPGCKEQLWMFVVNGFGDKPLMLLTTERLRWNRKVLWSFARRYFRRWAIEETIRFIKQSYDIENVRVLRYRALQNLIVLALLATHFACAILGLKAKLRVMAGNVVTVAKRIFGAPDFVYYAIADGIRTLFARHPGAVTPRPPTTSGQLFLFPT